MLATSSVVILISFGRPEPIGPCVIGFEISASGSTVLGFAFDGSVVPAGNGVLTNLEIVVNDAALTGCLSNVVLSDNDGDQITRSGILRLISLLCKTRPS